MYAHYSKKIKVALLLAFGLITLLSYQNCSRATSGSIGTSSSLTSSTLENSYEQQALTVLTTRCSSCHDSENKTGGVDVLDINGLLASGVLVPNEPSFSLLFTEIQNGNMPPGKALSQKETQAIFNWIQEGFKEQPVVIAPPTSEPIPLAANFKSINANILVPKCLRCHNSNNTSGGVSFSSYASALNTVQKTLPANSTLYTSVATRKTMPRGAAALSEAETKVIFDWITAGAANN